MVDQPLRNSAFCRNILLISVVNFGMGLGYALTCLNPVVPVLADLYNDTYQNRYGESLPSPLWTTLLSLTMSMIIAGAFFGSITVTYVLEILSRKQAMIFWSVLVVIGAIIISAVPGTTGSYEAFIIGRFVVGYGLGLGMNTVAVIVAEFSTRRDQGMYQSMIGAMVSVGSILGPTFGHPKVLGTHDRWPILVSLSCLLPVIYICCSPLIPESPYFLLRQNKRNKAVELVKKLRVGSEDDVLNEILAMEQEQQGLNRELNNGDEGKKTDFVGIKRILKTPQYRRQLLLVMMLYGGSMATGINHVMLFSDQIFISGGIPGDVVTYVTIGVFCTQTVSAFAAVKLLSIFGGVKLTLATGLVVVIAHIITTTGLATHHLSQYAGYASVGGILLFLTSWSGGPNIAVFALAGELTIEPTRPTVLNFSGGFLWFTAWLSGFLAPYMDEGLGPYAFLIWSGLGVAFVALTYLFVPETKGKTIEEIQACLQ